MQIDWWTLGLQAVNVVILIWILGRFLFQPVAAMIEQRRVEAAKLIDEARATREEAAAERQKAVQQTAGLALARSEALKKITEEADAERQAILAAARAEADRLRAAADSDIARANENAIEAHAARARQLAIDIAAKLLARLPDAARIAGFIDGLAEGVATLPAAIRAGLGTGGTPIRLKAARALTVDEMKMCRERLSRILGGRPIEIALEVDPTLLAGLEMDMPHASVRNSFRADLDRIEAALTQPASTQTGRQAPRP
ncbi:F0F1 ATP synthase subunit delta [Rhodopila sp.]|uniref:F0F1 ATP synthase subunit delta n=1 Tax=Rhodopila sp. TaxID=2480087 RepID=UPI002D0CBE45|nr:F0F1 ATP synthase subunit delta [Rhodopila sp.]HVZ10000.1 F0F1 ATP synthase subunit delta [Rhodopila sp.]